MGWDPTDPYADIEAQHRDIRLRPQERPPADTAWPLLLGLAGVTVWVILAIALT